MGGPNKTPVGFFFAVGNHPNWGWGVPTLRRIEKKLLLIQLILAICVVNPLIHEDFVIDIKPFYIHLYDIFGVFKHFFSEFRFFLFLRTCPHPPKSLEKYARIFQDFGKIWNFRRNFATFSLIQIAHKRRWYEGV